MAVKKSDLYASLWASCDALRGGMDASNYKDYVLVLLFLKYISDKYAGQPYGGITVPPGTTFADLAALKGKADIGDRINKHVIAPLVDANDKLNLADFPDFNDGAKLGTGKEKVDRLTRLISIFQRPELDFSKNRADHDDLLGDAYEYLIRHFATESGKSKGQFYTPAEVSQLIAQLVGIGDPDANVSSSTTVYDPTCGSGSLLLKVASQSGQHVTLYGQEKDTVTSGLARMNMILHGYPTADIQQGNTLSSPRFLNQTKSNDTGTLQRFDYVVANPPFSDKGWTTGLDPEHDPHERFTAFGVPPAKQGDYAYLLHILASLKSTGTGACILPHGVLFRGNAEAAIREKLVTHGVLKAVIGLPANLFYGTGIPACILLLDKHNATARRAVLMIDASRGFRKDGPKNSLRDRDAHRIVDAAASTTLDQGQPGYARLVPFDELEANAFNLNLPRYLDGQDPEDIQDLAGHLQGGVPAADVDALDRYWAACPGLKDALFTQSRPGYHNLTVPPAQVSTAIDDHPQFAAFVKNARDHFDTWRTDAAQTLRALKPGDPVKPLIHGLAESLLAHYAAQALISRYPVYQHLMDYWAQTLQDDAHLIAADGWSDAAHPQRIIETTKAGKTKDKGWASELVPKPLLVARHFPGEQAALDELDAAIERHEAELTEYEEEHSGDDGVFADFEKINAAAVKARIKELKGQTDAVADTALLKGWLAIDKARGDAKKKHKAAAAALDEACFAKFADLSAADLQDLVVDDKWLATVGTQIAGETDRVRQALTGRVKELADRYVVTLGELSAEADAMEKKVAGHLKKMGLAWT